MTGLQLGAKTFGIAMLLEAKNEVMVQSPTGRNQYDFYIV